MAKVKCNFQPRCLRCTNKGLECVYDAATASASVPAPTAAPTRESQVADEQPAENVSPVFTLGPLADDEISSTFNDLCASSGSINMDEAQVNLDWDGFDFIESGMLSKSPKFNLPHFESAQATVGQFLHKGNPDGI